MPGPKKEPEEKVKAKTEFSMKIKRADLAKIPEPSAKADKFLPPKRPGPDIVKDSDHYFNRTIFYQQSRGRGKVFKNYSKAAKLNSSNFNIYNNIRVI